MKNSTLVFLVFSFFTLTGEALAQECLSGGCAFSGSQFPAATQSTTSATFVTVSTLIFAGEWQRYSVTSGATYQWSLCTADGGSASYDSQLTLYQDDGSTILCYSDDNCGDDAKIQWVASYTGFVRTKVNEYNCLTNSTATTLVWRRSAAPPASLNCGSAITLCVALPLLPGIWQLPEVYTILQVHPVALIRREMKNCTPLHLLLPEPTRWISPV